MFSDPSGLSPQDVAWFDLHRMDTGEYQFPPFPPVVRAQIEELQATFADVCADPVEKWEDDFRRDHHPLREIEIWKTMAKTYRSFAGAAGSQKEKEEIFRVILTCCHQTTEPEFVWTAVAPTVLTKARLQESIDHYLAEKAGR